jgi:hypothetical protein
VAGRNQSQDHESKRPRKAEIDEMHHQNNNSISWSDGRMEGSSNNYHFQERRLRGPEELEANYDYELHLPD